jgi:predicted signal transduction protein with EAL and GGDEF domain
MHGHQTGDIVLAKLGAAVRTVSSGIIGRLGGEEFCLLVSCDLADAVEVAESVRRTIKALRFTQPEPFGITCSSGVAEWESGDTIDRILRRADMAMYEAKNKGRDHVVAADSFAVTGRHEKWRGTARTTSPRKQWKFGGQPADGDVARGHVWTAPTASHVSGLFVGAYCRWA